MIVACSLTIKDIKNNPSILKIMKYMAIAVLLIFLAGVVIPAAAVDDEKYGYVKIENIDITLDKDQANINVEYTLDEPTRVLVLLLGKQDLKNKILKIINYEDAEVRQLDMERAELVVEDVSYNYGRGIYWFPDHRFNVVIPTLRIETPQASKEFAFTSEITNGMGYFDC